MRKYLYIIFAIGALFTACEPTTVETPKHDVSFIFSTVNVETTQTSATITTAEHYMTVDGKKYEAAVISLEYIIYDNTYQVYDYTTNDGNMVFTIEGLKPNTTYEANIIIDGGKYGKEKSYTFSFTTKGTHTPTYTMSCSADIQAKGLMATINLSNVAYLADDKAEAIKSIKVEYSRLSLDEWVAYEFEGSELNNGAMTVALPFEGEDYLVENRNYELSVTLTPANSDYTALSSEKFQFKTEYAEVTANIAAPALSYDSEGIHASVNDIEVFYDGVDAAKYKDGYPIEYSFLYRTKNAAEWTETKVEASNGNISVTIPASELTQDTTYEVKAAIVAGAMSKIRESAIAEVTTPKGETPTPPTPPTGGDTSSIAGTWHLTQWRGAEPGFEVYMDITTTGGVTLYQRMESNYWEVFLSSAEITDGIISGVYSDGVAWGASYNVTINGDTMTWVDTTDTTDISVYTRSELPTHMPTAPTRAIATSERFL